MAQAADELTFLSSVKPKPSPASPANPFLWSCCSSSFGPLVLPGGDIDPFEICCVVLATPTESHQIQRSAQFTAVHHDTTCRRDHPCTVMERRLERLDIFPTCHR
mmetsp:Transcript_4144/g.11303  ORF Transcript_4144/g.11303 Transcript_4144/m.11303 type:complete len:105 (+) Transcript_4144:102-416(+)